ncbi:MAG: hypothetical protein ACI30A_07250 [Paludibacteraceae bacterium]
MKEFDKDIIEVVWEKAHVVKGYDPAKFRKDACGAWITRDKYGDRSSNFGWVIDHICPLSLLERHHVPEEAINDIMNLQPMHWANDASKAESYPIFLSSRCGVEGDNISLVQSFVINDGVRSALGKLFDPFFVQC